MLSSENRNDEKSLDVKSVPGVIAILRERIAANILPPGTKLIELELSKEFGVSRQIIREAFTRLEMRGLVSRIQNRGAYVAKFSYEDIMNLYDIRESLSILAHQLAARNAPDGAWEEDIADFAGPVAQIVEEKDDKAFSAAIVKLDKKVLKYANNQYLDPMLEPLSDLTQVLTRRMMLLPDRLSIALALNQKVLRALAARDEEAVRLCFHEIMNTSREYLTKYKLILL